MTSQDSETMLNTIVNQLVDEGSHPGHGNSEHGNSDHGNCDNTVSAIS